MHLMCDASVRYCLIMSVQSNMCYHNCFEWELIYLVHMLSGDLENIEGRVNLPVSIFLCHSKKEMPQNNNQKLQKCKWFQ